MARVVVENLYKTFPQGGARPASNSEEAADTEGVTVLRRINLTIEDGEFMVLVGPSGCGKSTLLRLLSGLEEATAGTIKIGGRRVNELPPKQRDTAMVFQSYALYPHLTVYDNLAFGLRRMPVKGDPPSPTVIEASLEETTVEAPLEGTTVAAATNPSLQMALAAQTWWQPLLSTATHPLPSGLRYRSPAERLIHHRVQAVAKMLQIAPLLDRYPRQLSGGQKQRVALGRAIARNPQVFLMDEPLSNLDAKLRNETRAQIVNLQKQLDITTIYVTHDQVEAMTMGDRIAVINQGQIQQVAPPLELYQAPANRFVAEFIGSPTMNFLPVQIKAPLVVTHDDFRLTLPGGWEERLQPYDGQVVTLGIRPEHLSLSLPAPKNLPVRVTRIEALGSETYLNVMLKDTNLQVRISPERPVHLGEELWLAIAPEQVHLFERETGNSLGRPISEDKPISTRS